MEQIFLEPSSICLEKEFEMSHKPQQTDMGSCGNCQGACFCRTKAEDDYVLTELI